MADTDQVLAGSMKSKLRGTATKVMPAGCNAARHRSLAEPGSGDTR